MAFLNKKNKDFEKTPQATKQGMFAQKHFVPSSIFWWRDNQSTWEAAPKFILHEFSVK